MGSRTAAEDEKTTAQPELPSPPGFSDVEQSTVNEVVINESGHVQELDRQFSLLSVCAVGIVTGNTWVAFGGSIATALFNGGPPGVIYEFIAVSVFYWLITASLAELASAVPSSAGVYQWASITAPPKYGRINGFFAGHLNYWGWMLGTSSIALIIGNQVVQMYALFHTSFTPQKWHVFIVYIIMTWICCGTVLFFNRALPTLNNIGMFFIVAGVFITIVVCAAMPKTHADSGFVWREWQNEVGYGSDGFVFLLGMLNGAFAVGTPDVVTHLAEEIPRPKNNVPKAMAAQVSIGFFTALCYMITIFYATMSLPSSDSTFPIAQVYAQATGSRAGTLGLLIVMMLPTVGNLLGSFVTVGRTLWTLSRDNATPFSPTLSRISPTFHNPFNATLACGIICSLLGCIYIGSSTAFAAFAGSFAVLTTLSYLAAILPHVLTRRRRLPFGPFRMKGWIGWSINIVACAYIMTFVVVFCFPYSLPVAASNMNYTVVVLGGVLALAGAIWIRKGGVYKGPMAGALESDEDRSTGAEVGERGSAVEGKE